MAASSQAALQEQRATLIAKVEQTVTHKANLSGQALILHFRVVLQDLPYAGLPTLLLDDHRLAIEKLVDRAAREDVKIFSITGHTSEPGTDQFNEDLALQRAQAVFDHLRATVDQDTRFADNGLYSQVRVGGRGESQPVVATVDEGDNPLNRRVEIAYRLKIVFPQPPGGIVPRSRFWKVDFSAGGGTGSGSGLGEANAVGLEAGVGTLTMLPDDETGQTQSISRTLTYESLGISVGLLSILKKLKFVQRFPTVKRLLDFLSPDAGAAPSSPYPITEELLRNAGFAVDIVSEGGGFFVEEPLSFEEMASFNFARVSGNLSWLATGSGSLILLHSPNFFASTVVYGGGLKIGLPDASLEFVPIAFVQVNL